MCCTPIQNRYFNVYFAFICHLLFLPNESENQVCKIIISPVILFDCETSFLSEINNIFTKNSFETCLTANALVTFKSSEIVCWLRFIEKNIRVCISNFLLMFFVYSVVRL